MMRVRDKYKAKRQKTFKAREEQDYHQIISSQYEEVKQTAVEFFNRLNESLGIKDPQDLLKSVNSNFGEKPPKIMLDFVAGEKLTSSLDKKKVLDVNLRVVKMINKSQENIMTSLQSITDFDENQIGALMSFAGYKEYCKLADFIEIELNTNIFDFFVATVQHNVFSNEQYLGEVKKESKNNPLAAMLGDQFQLPDITELVVPMENGFLIL